jgi:hypothetical protein
MHTYIHALTDHQQMIRDLEKVRHTCIHAYMHTFIHAYIHTYMHTYIHTCIHTYMHSYIHTGAKKCGGERR